MQTVTSDGLAAAVACALAASLSACGSPHEATADAAPPVRVMVKLVRSSTDPAAIAAEATRVAGVPATYAAATSPTWHALSLRCADSRRCETAIARLRAATAIYDTVEFDGRKTPSAS